MPQSISLLLLICITGLLRHINDDHQATMCFLSPVSCQFIAVEVTALDVTHKGFFIQGVSDGQLFFSFSF